jgi:hypothetical protein
MSTNAPSPLVQLILRQDLSAVDHARQRGPAAAAEAGSLLGHEDAEIRFLAVNCVVAAGGADAPRFLIKAAMDDDEQSRTTAAKALLDNPPKGLEREVLEAWDRQSDPTVRYYLALSLGLAGDSTKAALKQRLARLAPTDPVSTRDSLVGALTRQGEVEAMHALRALILEAHGPRVPTILEVFRYVDNPTLVGYLRPLLGRHEEAIDLSDHVRTFTRRSSDLAIDEIARLLPDRLSFRRDPSIRYSGEQFAEAARLLDGLPEPP